MSARIELSEYFLVSSEGRFSLLELLLSEVTYSESASMKLTLSSKRTLSDIVSASPSRLLFSLSCNVKIIQISYKREQGFQGFA